SPFIAALRSAGPPMASGSRSVAGTAIIEGLPPRAGAVASAPVMSAAGAGGTGTGGDGATRALSSMFGAIELLDCFSAGVGDIRIGAGIGVVGTAGIAGFASISAGAGAGAWIAAAGAAGAIAAGARSLG